ncbi:hypothetical protein [Vibrio taketomensis]|uniref:hypothetical protein n=1 Tax=Vibrio taketomensis TaxID=2572923 RepID=UPI00138953B3|nr:hypothetical protein [Vibrio taketomensis]
MSLLASIQLTNQRGNAGADTYVGTVGGDRFEIDGDDVSVSGHSGVDSIVASSTATHKMITDSAVTWQGSAQSDKSVIIAGRKRDWWQSQSH